MPVNPKTTEIIIDGENLTAEAKVVVHEAVASVKNWIDTHLDAITAAARKELQEAEQRLAEQQRVLAADQAATQHRLAALADKISRLDLKLAPADFTKLVAELTTATQAVKDDLEAQTKRYHDYGVATVGLVKKAIGLLV